MKTIAVVGLGYVGLPLAIEFGKKFKTIGYDRSSKKIQSYLNHTDPTGEMDSEEFLKAEYLNFTIKPEDISQAELIVIAVPTPVDIAHQPDFSQLISASEIVGKYMKKGSIIVYESTVYPGATEDICVPVLEQYSGLTWKEDFHIGYSPERINPGDKEHKLVTIKKVVSADDDKTLKEVEYYYGSIIEAGIYIASSIKVAEAAKVIENTQRDLNIALMNELAILFNKLGIDTVEVLEAAGSKWNFLSFRPGLVGGHCIGVDPYYLTHKAEMVNYHPQVILAGRRINDNMGKYIAEQTVKMMIKSGSYIHGSKVNVLGLTFKENCSDLRNSRVVDIIDELKTYGIDVYVNDPIAEPEEAKHEYNIDLMTWDKLPVADAIVVAVAHNSYRVKSVNEYLSKLCKNACVIDVKSILAPRDFKNNNINFWRL